ncbi:hypothetical protein Poli38472_008639 [Pythium oligandrum]|uniref:Uncharacterized protein n=1 Tax=Pythium oligandrum TaxID=41045 RepID=A0A8K1C3X2_PYTOL|nr:hypothetical protein Poli38472_008639 [Pythium oligandrum]|eukprot:TMW55991.1 hypothetical protein Poli38472_008639 [Pythium oligandrum]
MPLLRRLHQERTRLSEEQASSTEATAEILGRLDFGDALRTSAHLNQPDTFKWLLSAGVPVRDEPGLLSELHVTAKYQLLKAFITARPSAAQGFGETMDFVVASETFETIQFFVSTKFGKWTPWAITEATMRGDLAILNILLDECVAVPPVGALKHAVSTRRLDIVKLLRPKCTSATILSGLLVAATSGNADIVEALLTEPMQGPYLPVLAAALANGHEFVAKVITGRLALHTADCYLLEAAKRNEARVVEFLMKRRFRAEEAAMVGTEQPFMREFMQRLVRDNYSKMVEDITRESAMRKCRW